VQLAFTHKNVAVLQALPSLQVYPLQQYFPTTPHAGVVGVGIGVFVGVGAGVFVGVLVAEHGLQQNLLMG